MGDLLFASRGKGLGGLNSIDHVSYCDCFGSLCSGVLIYSFENVAQTVWGNPSLYSLQHRRNATYLLGRE